MKTGMYSVYDSKANCFCTPFFSENDATAVRAFRYAANDQTIEIGKYPSDFTLFAIGQFDSETGQVSTLEPVSLALALTLVNQPETEVA